LNKSNKVLFVKIKKYLSNSEQRNLAPQKWGIDNSFFVEIFAFNKNIIIT
jgi:hypothetical protein